MTFEIPTWRWMYAEELDRFPVLSLALAEENPIGAVAKRAGLSEIETRVLGMWAGGDSVRDIALAQGRHRAVVENLILRTKYKVLLWLIRSHRCLQTDSL